MLENNLKEIMKSKRGKYMKKFDTAVIGFGKAGKTLASTLSKKGESVALIEKDPMMYGGTCINVGCIPSKRLVSEAENAPKGDFEAKIEHFRKSIKEKKEFIKKLNQANYDMLINAGVKVIDGEGSFIDKNTIQIKDKNGNTTEIKAQKIIINTGAYPFLPEIENLKNNPKVFVSETIMNLEELPKKLTIIGTGYIGLEFASMFSNFGSEVTLLQNNEEFLPREDEDVANEILKILQNKGVKLIENAISKKCDGGNIYFEKNGEEHLLEGEVILVATGRRPNINSLSLENAGVEITSRNAVKTDEYLRTNVENIWAVGDVRGELQFTYISLDDSRIVLSDINGDNKRTKKNRGEFAYSAFIEPALSRVGITEKEAKEKGLNYKVSKIATNTIPKAKILKQTEGFLKVLIDEDTKKILGAALLCPESYEIINIIKLAMDNNLEYTALRDFMYTHPTISESFNNLFDL